MGGGRLGGGWWPVQTNYIARLGLSRVSQSGPSVAIEEKRKLFAIRNKMINIAANFPKHKNIEKCICGESENLEHLYTCKSYNNEISEIPYKNIYSKNMHHQIEIFRKMEKILNQREKVVKTQIEIPCDLTGSTTSCSIE